ncbi:uncharacterized protein [Physcomitrium patens]|uniref:Uncharacterized protein n=1 Tax=Physcomitrium patens TaxID=3218 RepID=A0A2K1IA34_PHYPA|nr:mucin-5AC-like [Physcomitrium patens]PNR26140.1 hypothetical protein PHYPA_030714 [Physcomitrium patens]|eukprot:XP_024367312.1 mucin-5AC-like [Physcomitrella patens]
MSGQTQRLNVAPTITMMGVVKTRLMGATKGHQMLKRKSDALTLQFRQIMKRIVETKQSMRDLMKASMFSLTEVKCASGDNIKHVIFENVGKSTIKVETREQNIAGVKIPQFESLAETGELKINLTGLAQGGQQFRICRTVFLKLLEVLVELASLQSSFLTLDEVIKTTNRRVNALKNVVKPKLENTIVYIRAELDELEREEFFRLKKVQAFKKKEVEEKLVKNKSLEEQMAMATSTPLSSDNPSSPGRGRIGISLQTSTTAPTFPTLRPPVSIAPNFPPYVHTRSSNFQPMDTPSPQPRPQPPSSNPPPTASIGSHDPYRITTSSPLIMSTSNRLPVILPMSDLLSPLPSVSTTSPPSASTSPSLTTWTNNPPPITVFSSFCPPNTTPSPDPSMILTSHSSLPVSTKSPPMPLDESTLFSLPSASRTPLPLAMPVRSPLPLSVSSNISFMDMPTISVPPMVTSSISNSPSPQNSYCSPHSSVSISSNRSSLARSGVPHGADEVWDPDPDIVFY